MGTINAEKRARTWVLIHATDPDMVVPQVSGLDHGNELVMIRVDVVDGGPANIVASFDAAETYYEEAISDIRAINGIINVWFLRVTRHNPELPHNASGYITEYEAQHPESEKIDIKVGRQDNSPGFNPWG